jgi:hypothetical protein
MDDPTKDEPENTAMGGPYNTKVDPQKKKEGKKQSCD